MQLKLPIISKALGYSSEDTKISSRQTNSVCRDGCLRLFLDSEIIPEIVLGWITPGQ